MLSEAKYIQGSCVITETQLAISNTFVTAAKVLGLGARAFDLAPALGIASNLALRLGADRLALTLANRSMQLLGTLEQTSALFRSLRFFGQQFNTHNVGAGTGWTVWGGATLVLDLGLRAVGAPKEATDVSGVASHDLTPWANVGFRACQYRWPHREHCAAWVNSWRRTDSRTEFSRGTVERFKATQSSVSWKRR